MHHTPLSLYFVWLHLSQMQKIFSDKMGVKSLTGGLISLLILTFFLRLVPKQRGVFVLKYPLAFHT